MRRRQDSLLPFANLLCQRFPDGPAPQSPLGTRPRLVIRRLHCEFHMASADSAAGVAGLAAC
jgi:hypothetical protein